MKKIVCSDDGLIGDDRRFRRIIFVSQCMKSYPFGDQLKAFTSSKNWKKNI